MKYPASALLMIAVALSQTGCAGGSAAGTPATTPTTTPAAATGVQTPKSVAVVTAN